MLLKFLFIGIFIVFDKEIIIFGILDWGLVDWRNIWFYKCCIL